MASTQKRQESPKERTTPGRPAAPALRPPRQLRSGESLAKMLEAGRCLIEEHANFDLVLVSDVIRTAGTSNGAFYGRFKDKDAFIASVLDAAFVEIQADADRVIRDDPAWSEGTASEIAARIVRYYVDMCRRNHGLFKAVLRHFAALDPNDNPMRWLDRHIQSMVLPVLAKKIQGKPLDASEAEGRIAMQMLVGTVSMALLTNPGPMRFDGDLIETKLTEMMLSFLRLS